MNSVIQQPAVEPGAYTPIAVPLQVSDLCPTQQWACHLAAPVVEMYCLSHSAVACYPVDTTHREIWANYMHAWWNVSSADELQQRIDQVINGMHQKSFQWWCRYIMIRTEQECDVETKQLTGQAQHRFKVARHYHHRLSKPGILAWDVARAAWLVRQGWALGWMDQAEFEQAIMKCGAVAHDAFTSWQSYGESFFVGLQYWQESLATTSIERSRAIMSGLLLNNEAPWRVTPWPTSIHQHH